MEETKVHESVLVGCFCQAAGWVTRDLEDRRQPPGNRQERFLRAINLSHNPLDPAIGDVLLQFDDHKGIPIDFHIFEFKVNWRPGINDEKKKYAVKHGGKTLTADAISCILKEFPEAAQAHWYGALTKTERKNKTISAASYWDAMRSNDDNVINVLGLLMDIVGDSRKNGFTAERLEAYIKYLNQEAETGTKAADGSLRFAVAYHDYQIYTFSLQSIIEYRLEQKRRYDAAAQAGSQSQDQPDNEINSEYEQDNQPGSGGSGHTP